MDAYLSLIVNTYYTLPIMLMLQIMAVIVSFYKRKKFEELHYFHFYPLIGLVQSVVVTLSIIFFGDKSSQTIAETSVNLFALAEVGLIYHLEFQLIKARPLKKILWITVLAFLLYATLIWFFTNAFTRNSNEIFPIEEIVLLVPTALYFFQLFKLPDAFNFVDH